MRFPTILRTWWPLAMVLLFAGCITIEENYTFKKDGSGTMEYVVDLSTFADLMKSMEGLSDGKSKDGMGEMDMKDEMQALKGIKGISKVKVKEEKDGFIQRLSFRFADVQALNAALNVIMPDSTGAKQEFFSWEGSTLVRRTNRFATELGSDMAGDGGSEDSTDMTGILRTMQYKYSFGFAKEIGEVGVADGVVREDPSPKQVKLSTDWSVIMKDPKALDLRITLGQ